jgi:hypothetical protein
MDGIERSRSAGARRTTETVLLPTIWAVPALVTQMVLRRMARRQTGSQVEAARDASPQCGELTPGRNGGLSGGAEGRMLKEQARDTPGRRITGRPTGLIPP